ncbi:MAG: hypothetical protein RQ735_02200 [Flavobacteriaceae bacterium]|nr:hypothetical protein [Flavobacteriaceae bacterium]
MKKMLLLLCVCIGFLNCSDDDENANPLLGVWVWTGSSGGIGGVIETPESTGIIMKLDILPKTIKRFRNGVLVAEFNYTLETRTSSLFNKTVQVIVPEDSFAQIVDLQGDVLTLIDDCADCFTSRYIRE